MENKSEVNMTDIGYETSCPKCGLCPKDAGNEYRHWVVHFEDRIIAQCRGCQYTWSEPCQDRGQPKVLGKEGERDDNNKV